MQTMQLTLDDVLIAPHLKDHIAGETYNAVLDADRLTALADRVFDLMRDGKWRTLAEIKQVTGGSEGGIGARLRDMRKIQYGSHTVDRERVKDSGLWQYRLTVNFSAVNKP